MIRAAYLSALCVVLAVGVRGDEGPIRPCRALRDADSPASLFVKLLSRRLTFALLGAHDGVANDHAYRLAVKHRWSGVALEPHEAHHARAAATYRASGLRVDVIRAAACTSRVESLPFYSVNTDDLPFPWWVKQISSLSEQHVLSHNRLLDRAPTSCGDAGLPDTCLRDKIIERLEETRVPCAFTHDLARRYAPDLLISDVEGMDDVMVTSWLEAQRPRYIVAEIKNLVDPEAFLRRLVSSGYCVRDDAHDVYAIATT